ncbi:hypothetical protein SISSUDRAFT_1039682 [Sistotremastrum suecicum HHB10207 ss-3]|uniref:Nudix hydrolase domain-containing protein n=1 Tax=Sistotremastrum suecicum HHB10207 ss-3 TaxID=1314776 RepID=A0A166IIS4_9AGAM|nr:hypothetical protein SISSUDRAFT_1039682 [Sistotremastrum suecicum HHB10207 ss-3]
MNRRSTLIDELNIDSSITLKESSKICLRNLAAHKPRFANRRYPRKRCAAVLVALFVGRMGDLYVILSSRAKTLRTYAGDTSLPGGKWEEGDEDMEDTARREAFEEIGLPIDRHRVPLLCVLDPFLARNQLIVTPVVVLIKDNRLEPVLNKAEVSQLFSHPLRSLLQTTAPLTMSTLIPAHPYLAYQNPDTHYYSWYDIKWHIGKTPVRMHTFLTGREDQGMKPLLGLTASILIEVAEAGYKRAPSFAKFAPGEPPRHERIKYAMVNEPLLAQAAQEDGITEWLARSKRKVDNAVQQARL